MSKFIKKRELNQILLNTKAIQKAAQTIAEKKLEKSKQQLINQFTSHKVSKEIMGGSSASNSSGTLGGYGNLFSFIGFSSGSNPVQEWVQIIQNKIRIMKVKKNIEAGTISFEINSITNEDLSKANMPWEGGKSWIQSIERGISGFSFYVSKSLGRSGGGVQSNNQVRSSNYAPTPYWTKMWQSFVKNLNN